MNNRVALLILAALLAPALSYGQTDEIQVYDGALADQGKFNLTLHNNFTPRGSNVPAFPGALVTDKLLNGVPEWAYGVTKWFELGLYMPLYSVAKDQGAVLNGFKIRTLFAVPRADERQFFYGVNFEFSYNAKHWDPKRFTSEIRPIIGWHFHSVDVILNPILDTSYNGVSNLDFAPATRVAHNINQKWAVGLEEYGDYGPLHQFHSTRDQSHQLYLVVDRRSKIMDVEAGVGFGLTAGSDKLTLKLILSRDLN